MNVSAARAGKSTSGVANRNLHHISAAPGRWGLPEEGTRRRRGRSRGCYRKMDARSERASL